MKRYVAAAALTLLLEACGGGGGAGDGGDVPGKTAACDVPLAGQCATLTTSQATWDQMNGEAAWAEQCATGAAGHAGTVVVECPTANRVGRCTLTISSATATAVVVYGYYSPTFTLELAAEACTAIHGSFSGE